VEGNVFIVQFNVSFLLRMALSLIRVPQLYHVRVEILFAPFLKLNISVACELNNQQWLNKKSLNIMLS